MQTPMTIVQTTMGNWPMGAPDKIESVTIKFEKGRAVSLNGKKLEPFDLIVAANEIGGRNGLGLSHALENRIIGTKSRGVYEAPGMELLGQALRYIYQAILDRRATDMFAYLSKFIANQVYDGRYFDLATQAAFAAIDTYAELATGTVKVGLYKGNILFQSLTGVKASLYFEENASMEDAQKGLNPVSSQGFAEIQSVEARSMAKAKQIK
jgi:argininosuccinate synthase